MYPVISRLASLLARSARTQLSKLLSDIKSRFAACLTDSFSGSNNFAASTRNFSMYFPYGIRSI
jgi:hypothetical protein